MSKGTYRLQTKIKYIFRAIKKCRKKKGLLKNIIYILRTRGVRGLKEAIVSEGQEEEIRQDIFQKQQEETQSFEAFSKTILFIIYGDSVDIETSAAYATINMQKGPQDEILVVDNGISCFEEKLTTYSQDYVFFIKEGNYVTPDMRSSFGKVIEEESAKIIYSDECIYDGMTGEIIQYYIKPEFSLYDLYQNNMLQQAVLFDRKYLLENYDIFSETIGGNVFAWTVKCARNCSEIVHVPRVLLLRKEFPCFEELLEQRNVLEQLLKEVFEASVTVGENTLVITPNIYNQKVSIIILHSDDVQTQDCVSAIRCNTVYINYDISVVIDERLKDTITLPKNINSIFCKDSFSYTQRCNYAVNAVSGDVVILMMDNQRVRQGNWLSKLLESLSFPGIAAVSPKIVRPEDTIRFAGMIAGGFGFTALPFNGEKNERVYKFNDPAFMNRQISVLSASCFAVIRDVYVQAGGFNEVYFDSKFANAQLSFELQRLGFGCVFCADVSLISYSNEWYDSWYDKNHATAYINLLKLYGNQLTEDKFFTSEMKYQYLRGVPIEFRMFQKKKYERRKKSILIVSHDSMLGGATLVLQYAADILKKAGYYVTWLSEAEGGIFHELEKSEIPYIIDSTFKGSDVWLNYAMNYDLVICNTIMLIPQVESLKKLGKQVVWWIHEASEYYEYIDTNILSQENIEHLCCLCVGMVAQRNFQQHFPFLKTNILLYGIPDFLVSCSEADEKIIDNPRENLLFLSIGTIEKRKGQDILAEAVRLLDSEIREKCLFVFIGKPIQDDVFEKINQACTKYPDNVMWHEPVDRITLMKIFQQADVVLCTSREDPMPVFVTEGMMQAKILICSENTGSAGVLEDGIDGYIYYNDNAKELAEKISYVVSHNSELERMGRMARNTYERMFSMKIFEENLLKYIRPLVGEP